MSHTLETCNKGKVKRFLSQDHLDIWTVRYYLTFNFVQPGNSVFQTFQDEISRGKFERLL